MVTVLVAALAAALGILATVVATRVARARSARRLEPVREAIADHMRAISETLERVTSLAATAATRQGEELEPSLDLGTLLQQLVAQAAALTGAQAVAIRVVGPNGTPVVASFGTSDGTTLLDAALGPPDARPFRALTINWTYGPALEEEESAYRSAIVVPVVEEGAATGALVAYAGPSGVFRPEHLRTLRTLADDAAPGIANARRFAAFGQRPLTDALTGIRNRSGYELELEREVARAARTGRPLSLLFVALQDAAASEAEAQPEEADVAVREFAALLQRTVRATDIPCRRRAREFAVVLPETADDGARHFSARLREETGAAFGRGDQRTFSVGLVEWRPNETSGALDARAAAAVGRTGAAGGSASRGAVAEAIELGRDRRRESSDRPDVPPVASEPRSSLLHHVEREVARARREARPLVLVAMEVGDLRATEERVGKARADALRAHVAARVEESVDAGGVVSRLATDRYAVLLPQASAADAQTMVAVLQASLEVRPPEEDVQVAVSAGIGELDEGDDAAQLLDRTEQALEQARRAGSGAVVVARRADRGA